MSVQVSYSKQSLLGIILLIICLVLLEIISIIVLDQRDSCNTGLWDSGLFSQYSHNFVKNLCSDYKSIIDYEKPFKHWEPNQKTNSVNINTLGIRGHEINVEKNPETYRIIMLGGSAMYGVYATSDSSTIPALLEKKLEQENSQLNVEIINAGVNGASSYDEINLLKDRLLFLKPDMIFVYDGGNDLLNEISPIDEYSNDSSPDSIEKITKNIRNYYKTPHFIEFLDIVIQKKIFNVNENSLDTLSVNNVEKKVDLWKNRWKTICETPSMAEIDIIISIQPYLGVGDKTLSEWELQAKQSNQKFDVSEFYPLMIQELNNLDNCTMTLNLTDVFDDYSNTIFYDLIHVMDSGNKIVADRIYEEILPILKNHI